MTDAALGIHECIGGWAGKGGKSGKQIRAEGTKRLEKIYMAQKMGGSGHEANVYG